MKYEQSNFQFQVMYAQHLILSNTRKLNDRKTHGTVQLSIPGYVRTSLHAFQHEKPKRPQDSPYPWTKPIYGKNNQTLSEKAPAE